MTTKSTIQDDVIMEFLPRRHTYRWRWMEVYEMGDERENCLRLSFPGDMKGCVGDGVVDRKCDIDRCEG